jgi:hypothetical protein
MCVRVRIMAATEEKKTVDRQTQQGSVTAELSSNKTANTEQQWSEIENINTRLFRLQVASSFMHEVCYALTHVIDLMSPPPGTKDGPITLKDYQSSLLSATEYITSRVKWLDEPVSNDMPITRCPKSICRRTCHCISAGLPYMS